MSLVYYPNKFDWHTFNTDFSVEQGPRAPFQHGSCTTNSWSTSKADGGQSVP